MAPRTRKQKASATTDAKRDPKPPARGKRKQMAEEDADDDGRDGSKQFFAAARKSTKRKYNLDRARSELDKQVQEITGFINEEKNREPATNLGKALTQSLPSECSAIMAPAAHNSSARQMNNLKNLTHDKASHVLKQLQMSTKRYQTLATRDIGIKKPDWMPWTQDKKDLLDLNEAAMVTAARTINSLIVPKPKSTMTTKPDKAGVVEKLAWELFDGARPDDSNNTWGKIAQGQVRDFAGILRAMKET